MRQAKCITLFLLTDLCSFLSLFYSQSRYFIQSRWPTNQRLCFWWPAALRPPTGRWGCCPYFFQDTFTKANIPTDFTNLEGWFNCELLNISTLFLLTSLDSGPMGGMNMNMNMGMDGQWHYMWIHIYCCTAEKVVSVVHLLSLKCLLWTSKLRLWWLWSDIAKWSSN